MLDVSAPPTVRMSFERFTGKDSTVKSGQLSIESLKDGLNDWTLHSTCEIHVLTAWQSHVDSEQAFSRSGDPELGEDFYDACPNLYRGDF
eukprot:3761543-Rhodomonas_salina.1